VRFKVSINKKELLVPGLLCLLGSAAVLKVSASSAAKISGMGAGVLPVLFGSLLMLVGILWLFDSKLSLDDDDDAEIGTSIWRGCCGLVSGIFAFMLLGKYVGLVPGIFALAYITIMGDHRHSWRSALVLAAGAAVVFALASNFLPQLIFHVTALAIL